MFKISKLNDVKVKNFESNMIPIEQHLFTNGVKSINVYEIPEFIIKGTDDINEYVFSFSFDKPIEKLCDIDLNTSVDIDNFMYKEDYCFEINGSNSFEMDVVGKIYRIVKNTIVIQVLFISNNNVVSEQEYAGKFEIEFNLDDYINKDEKSDIL